MCCRMNVESVQHLALHTRASPWPLTSFCGLQITSEPVPVERGH